MIEFPFIGPSYPDETIEFSSQRTVNLYPERDQNYKYERVLTGFPGDTVWTKCGDEPIRGGIQFRDYALVLCGPQLYKVTEGGFASVVGTIDTASGPVDMDENGAQMMLVDGQDGWVWANDTLTKITDATFVATKADSVTHMDSYFLVNKPGSGQFWASDSFDGLGWDATRTATAEFKSDPIVVIRADRELFLGGTHTTQAYYNSGASPMPFEAIRSGRMIYGVAAKQSWAIVGNTSYFLAQDKNGHIFAGRLNGYRIERVSNRAWERIWAGYDYEDAIGFGIHFKGHEWYLLTFPQADHGWGRTFLFDIETGFWCEVGIYRPSVGDFGRHPMTCHFFFAGRNLFGDENGNLRELRDDLYTFNGTTMISLRRSPVLHDGRERLFFHSLALDMEVGNATPSVTDPQIMLRISDDGGHTWGNQRTRSISETKSNKYETNVEFRLLGSAYDRVYEVAISDNVSRKFLAGFVS